MENSYPSNRVSSFSQITITFRKQFIVLLLYCMYIYFFAIPMFNSGTGVNKDETTKKYVSTAHSRHTVSINRYYHYVYLNIYFWKKKHIMLVYITQKRMYISIITLNNYGHIRIDLKFLLCLFIYFL